MRYARRPNTAISFGRTIGEGGMTCANKNMATESTNSFKSSIPVLKKMDRDDA